MTVISEITPNKLNRLLDQIEKFQNSRSISWYRGTGSTDYKLLPTLARGHEDSTQETLRSVENGIRNTFSQRSPPFVKQHFSNDWGKLFYMQHYGIPTRLLDWSESPFVALYFALSAVVRDIDRVPKSDAVLWAIDPINWNKTVLSHISYRGGILDESCEEIKSYSPHTELEQRPDAPVMIYGTHNSPRIVAQRGVFSLFGKGTTPMEQLFRNINFPAGSMMKFIITHDKVDEMLTSLYRKGIAESTVYPDIMGLSLEIKRQYGYR